MEYIPLKRNVFNNRNDHNVGKFSGMKFDGSTGFRTVSTCCNNKENIYMTITSKITYNSINNQTG